MIKRNREMPNDEILMTKEQPSPNGETTGAGSKDLSFIIGHSFVIRI